MSLHASAIIAKAIEVIGSCGSAENFTSNRMFFAPA